MTDGQVAHARLSKHGHRPLGRTQSAPLPLGHPMLTSHNVLSIPPHYEEQRIQHNFLKQVRKAHKADEVEKLETLWLSKSNTKVVNDRFFLQQIRQTVLTRAGRQLEEQPEAVDESAEVIDLTERRVGAGAGAGGDGLEECEMSLQQKDREQFLQQQRDLMMRHNLQINEGLSAVS